MSRSLCCYNEGSWKLPAPSPQPRPTKWLMRFLPTFHHFTILRRMSWTSFASSNSLSLSFSLLVPFSSVLSKKEVRRGRGCDQVKGWTLQCRLLKSKRKEEKADRYSLADECGEILILFRLKTLKMTPQIYCLWVVTSAFDEPSQWRFQNYISTPFCELTFFVVLVGLYHKWPNIWTEVFFIS